MISGVITCNDEEKKHGYEESKEEDSKEEDSV